MTTTQTANEQTAELEDLRNRLLDAVGGWQTAIADWPPTAAEIHAAGKVRAFAAQLENTLGCFRYQELKQGRCGDDE